MMRKQGALNSKGFSIVELIIVIAIMAILVGVLAPQYIKYVEKSRKSSDLRTLVNIHDAIEAVVTDPAYEEDLPSEVKFVFAKKTDSETPVDPFVPNSGSVYDALVAMVGDPTILVAKSNACDGMEIVYMKATDELYYVTKTSKVTLDISSINDNGETSAPYTLKRAK